MKKNKIIKPITEVKAEDENLRLFFLAAARLCSLAIRHAPGPPPLRPPSAMTAAELKSVIRKKARSLGAILVGFANLARYRRYYPQAEKIYHPDAVWPEAKSVIVLGLPLPLPIVETTPSINYQELYNSSNVWLDQAAYRLSLEITALGHPSVSLPRDGYADLKHLIKRASSSFSHVVAGRLAGLGTIGWNHNLLTPQHGSRVRLNSVLTTAELTADPLIKKDLCLHCRACQDLCPAGALGGDPAEPFAELDHDKCTRRHQFLKKAGCWPCGSCTKVCPVGADREAYRRLGVQRYYREQAGQSDETIAAWNHVRRFGSERNVR
ncbi:MAG: 4Fe-4S dicluster domain-containing protein [Deltaproteobacteria bacterium]|nr:4Fe-4S dicluster domain-containing protein [Deltaproteobacteria bacterium]